MKNAIAGRATVLAATTTAHGKWYRSGVYRYDFVLEVRADDGRAPFRVELLDVRIYQTAPKPGTDLAVEIQPSDNTVEILWKGDPNLDLDAWRDQRTARDAELRRAALEGDTPAADAGAD